MFTGLVEELGKVENLKKGAKSAKLTLKADKVLTDVKLGDSIAVNGICLTVVEYSREFFAVEVMSETLQKTGLEKLKRGSVVNLERALRVGDRLGGHLVTGHIDGTGKIINKEQLDIAILIEIEAPEAVMKYILPKGSIAIDGISLTIVEHKENSFTVSIIPHTAKETTLGHKDTGEVVNLEGDLIGKYVEKFTLNKEETKNTQSKVNRNFLMEHGFY
ncbi:riboflavin synthase [Desulfitispora alkaliphila]|uniref:riboflavin synthase n=1 Tax=Desulfitispora alkaliphila TaxID=622674 RepID=UPI003D1F09A9